MSLPDGVNEDRRQTEAPSEDPTPALIAGLAAAASQLSTTAHELYRASVMSRIERVIAIAVVAVLGAVLCINSYGVLRLNNIAEVNRSNGDYIRDCTTPGGQCFEDSQKRLASVVAQLNRTTLVTIECADRLNGDDAITRCVQDALKEKP